ncbi:hypothetical protein [Duganella margarita]|uniref:hypothetical protein n=1 Tax=Duganella margarita TaxID=2692170 RepID=UPI0019290B82|nr:hypothetical protein [Duganella margarita]
MLAWCIAASAGYAVLEPAICMLGMGPGLIMPNMTMAVHNALLAARRGVGTVMVGLGLLMLAFLPEVPLATTTAKR